MKDTVKVLFLVQPHFSLLAFAAAADALTTANLVLEQERFSLSTVSLTQEPVISDLSITIKADHHACADKPFVADLLIVCGGYRCALHPDTQLTRFLVAADKSGALIGGLWNGVIALAHAKLMTGFACTLHRHDHGYARSNFPSLLIRSDSMVLDRTRLSAAGPNGSFELMLLLIQRLHGGDTVSAVRHILKADGDQTPDHNTPVHELAPALIPARLQRALQLMRNNLDEPLSRDDMAAHLGVSKRALERMFQQHFNTSPARYYMELRLNRAHQMLLQSGESITSIADNCGFVSGAHFSRSFAKHFGCSPSSARKETSRLLDYR